VSCLAAALIGTHISGAAVGVRGIIVSVSDGDTLSLETAGAQSRVRLVQIDAPELDSAECYSRASRTALLRLAPVGKNVSILVDPKLGRTDRHGRLLAYLSRKPVGNINIELVRRGAAAPYFAQGKRGEYAKQLMAAAKAAKAAKRGLWKTCPGTKLDPNHHVETGPSGP